MVHAFLIITHGDWELLFKLLQRLDHKNYYLYLHIDAKSDFSPDEQERLTKSVQKARLFFVERHPVYWGGYSQIYCELRLFEAALEHEPDYLHLISGNDFPLKNHEEFDRFFEDYKGYEFVDFASEDFNRSIRSRYNYYYFFQDKIGRDRGFLYLVSRGLLVLQKLLPFVGRKKRVKSLLNAAYGVEYEKVAGEKIKAGSNWASITADFARFLLAQEDVIEKLFSHAFCCDEVYKQTCMCYSGFYDRLYQPQEKTRDLSKNCTGSLRCVDWKRGTPYTFTIDDLEDLQSTQAVFCRKVSLQVEGQRQLVEQLSKM